MRYWICLLALAGFGVVVGCGGGAKVEGIVKVAGSVTYQGKSVEGATVVFSPTDGKGRAASGRTDSAGRFQLTTLNENDGALPGSYKVAVSKIQDNDPAHQITAEEMAKLVAGGKSAPKGPVGSDKKGGTEHLIPEKYENAETSGLTAEVPSGGKDDFAFNLN